MKKSFESFMEFMETPSGQAFLEEIETRYRVNRVNNKELENREKGLLNSPDVLDARDFVFEPFYQKRGNGDSGELLIATHKKDVFHRYIVKHAFCDCAANEFVYNKMARAINLKVPDVKLFRLPQPLDDTLFKTEYVVGIEYLNIIDKYPSNEIIATAKNADDYFEFHTLYSLFYESDRFEIVLADDGYIYRLDTTASFIMNDHTLMLAGSKYTSDEYRDYINKSMRRMKNFSEKWDSSYIEWALLNLINRFGEDKTRIFLEPLFKIQNIHKSYITKFLETLCYFYPECISGYYECFFTELKKGVTRFINSTNNHRYAPYFQDFNRIMFRKIS